MDRRARWRKVLDDVHTEFMVSGFVLLYMLLVLIDLVLYEDSCEVGSGEDESFGSRWSFYFNYVDMGFLVVFIMEILVRLYAYGPRYFMDCINGLDAAIIIMGSITQAMVLADFVFTSNLSFLRIVRLVRLVRLFIVMNKVQNARTAFKRTKYLKLGSPVERVMDLLNDMKTRTEEEDDEADILWIMHLIASDKLYSIDINSIGAGQDAEMAAYLTGDIGLKKHHHHGYDDDDEDGHAAHGRNSGHSDDSEHRRADSTYVQEEMSKEGTRIEEIVATPAMQPHIAGIHKWDLDVFDFADKAQGSGLVVAMHTLLQGYGLIDKFRISTHRLLTFTRRIADGYRAENPYHNSTHALDVLLNTNYFLRHAVLSDLIQPIDRLAALVASLIHDYQHPGLNNVFLQATKHDYAITYNDNSILESHHVAASWKVLLHDECNFLKGLSREQYLEIRDTIIQLVLGTDMKYHFEHYTKFKTKVQSETFKPGCAREDVKFLMSITMHTADIANPAKPMKYCLQWTELVMEEFFRQGDLEQQLGMPISPFYDRTKNNTAQCQIGFINVLVRPLYAEVTALLGEPAKSECFGALEANLKGWETHGNELFKEFAAGHVPAGISSKQRMSFREMKD